MMAKEQPWKEWEQQLAAREEDIRAEAIIADLMLDGSIQLDDLFLLPNGGFHRIVSKDVAAIHEPGKSDHDTDRAVVELNRKGLYDGLPEALFHQSRKPRSFKTLSEIKEEIRYQDQVERNARKYFAPLDNEINLTKCLIELNERSMTTELLALGKDRGLRKFWSIPDQFSKKQQGTLILLLPLTHRVVKDHRLIAQAMELVLEVPVQIEMTAPRAIEADPEAPITLGMGQLGVDMVTTGTFQDDDDVALVRIGPTSKEKATAFAYLQKGYKQFIYLCELLLPADREVQLEIELEIGERGLGLQKDAEFARLGVTTFLAFDDAK